MAQQIQELRYELEALKLQLEIDTVRREIDMTVSRFHQTSTPYAVDGGAVGFARPPRPLGQTNIVQEPDVTPSPPPKLLVQRPRRILPKTPPEIQRELSVHRSCQTESVLNETQGQSVTEHFENSTDQLTSQRNETSGSAGSGHDMMMRPATYDGSNSWTDYKAHFDACATLNGWDDRQKGLYLSVSLRGQAQGVFGNLDAGSTDYSSLVKSLEERFAPPNQTELYRVQLKSRQQRATESMAELGQDIRRLTNLAYPSVPNDVRETLAKEQFVDALVNAEMRLKVKQSRPEDLNDAVRHAVELESFYRAEKRQQGLVSSATHSAETPTTGHGDIKQSLKQIQDAIQRIDRENQRNIQPARLQTEHKNQQGRLPQQQVRQYLGNYKYNNHRQFTQNSEAQRLDGRSTTRRRQCFECGSEKHLRWNCPELNRVNPPNNPGNHNFNQSGSSSSAGLYARANVEGISVECLVDTGATLTLISNKLWKLIEHKHILSNFSTPIVSASGDTMKILGKAEVLLEFEDVRCPATVIVADMDVDIVLGIDFMKSCQVSIDVMKDVMTVKGKEVPLACVGKVGCFRIVLTEKFEIPAGTDIITTGKIQEPGVSWIKYGLVKPSERFVELGKGMVARTLVKAGEAVPLRMANLTEEAKTFDPGTWKLSWRMGN